MAYIPKLVDASSISGIVGEANGGTGVASFTATRVIFAGATTLTDDAGLTYVAATDFLTVAGAVVSPLIIGGTAVGSSLSLQSTSGVGTTDAIVFKVGSNGGTEAGRFTTAGQLRLPVVGSTGGILIGADVKLYRDDASGAAAVQVNSAGGIYHDTVGTRFGWNVGGVFLNWVEGAGTAGSGNNYVRIGAGNLEVVRFVSGGTSLFAGSVGFNGSSAPAQPAGVENVTNNVTVGGTTGTVDNVTAASVDTSAAQLVATRNAIYQLARKMKQCNDALRLYGLLS